MLNPSMNGNIETFKKKEMKLINDIKQKKGEEQTSLQLYNFKL